MNAVDILLTPIRKESYNPETKTFTFSELGIAFSMTYKLINPTTGDSRVFELSHSTGSEFDPDTEWIYKSDDGLTLIITQDRQVTKYREVSYLNHKTKNY